MSRERCDILRGISILLIILHNFAHLASPFKQNEFYYNDGVAQYFLDHFSSSLLLSTLSYYGWIGVVVFVFLSGYGLSCKYGGEAVQIDKRTFVQTHYIKLFLLICIPYIVNQFLIGGIPSHYKSFGIDLLFLRNIISIPGTRFSPFQMSPGPYWYMGLCMELYLYFALFHKQLSNRYFVTITAFFSLLCITVFPNEWAQYFRHNFIGWLPAFYLGYHASKIHFSLGRGKKVITLVVVSFLFAYTALYKSTWPISDFLGIASILLIGSYISSPVFAKLGKLSAFVFVCHPLIRGYFVDVYTLYIRSDSAFNNIFVLMAYLVVYVVACIALALVYKQAHALLLKAKRP